MNLFMNVSVETCRVLQFIIDIRIARELRMGSSLRQVQLFASLQLLRTFSLHVLSRSNGCLSFSLFFIWGGGCLPCLILAYCSFSEDKIMLLDC